MASSNKKILKNTIFLYVRMFVTMLVSLYTVRVVLRTLGIVDYGVYNVIGGFITSIAFISGVLSNASQRFFSVEIGKGDSESLNKTFNIVFLVYCLAGLFILFLTETVGLWFLNTKMDIPIDRNGAANWVYQFTIISFLITLISSPFESIIIANEKMNIYAYMSILDVVLKLAIVYPLVVFSVDKLKLYAVLSFLVTLITRIIYLTISKRLFKETKVRLVWDKNRFHSIFGYSTWILVGSISFILNTQGLNILFNLFFGPVANAAYAIGNHVKSAVNSFGNGFFMAARPPIIKSYAQREYGRTTSLFFFSSKIIFSLLFAIIVPLYVEIGPILNLWLDEVSGYMPSFVRLMLIYALVSSMCMPIDAIVHAAGKVRLYHGIVDVFTLVTLPISYVIFKLGGLVYWGFLVSIIVFFIAHIIRLVVLKSFYQISLTQYLRTIVFPIAVSIIVVGGIVGGVYILMGDNVVAVLIISEIVTLISLWLIMLNKTERITIIQFLKKKIRIKR